MSRWIPKVAKIKISTTLSCVTGPVELNEMLQYRHGPSLPVEGGGADVVPHHWLKVGCGYGRSSLFESAGAGICRCLRVLVQAFVIV